MKKKLLVSFSGGRTSAFMLWFIWHNYKEEYDIIVVFANTGKESEGTLRFVQACSDNWNIPITWVEACHKNSIGIPFTRKGWGVRHKRVTFETASRNGEPFEEMISLLGIPSTNAPFCSDQLKRKPIEHFLKCIKWKGYYKAIGIRMDEMDRVNEKYLEKKIIYPLISSKNWLHKPSKKIDILRWWSEQDFDLTIHEDDGNCNNCYKKDMPRLVRNSRRDPDGFTWWRRMQLKYGFLDPRKSVLAPPFNFYRGNKSVEDIFAMQHLSDAEINKLAKKQKLNSCSESCEPFK